MSETKKYFSNFFLDFENLMFFLKNLKILLPDVFFELTDSEKRGYINV